MRYLVLAAVLSSGVVAAEQSDVRGACKDVIEACKKAGFERGGTKSGKGLHVDCMGKLFKGEAVAGVNVDQAKLTACKERHEAMMENSSRGPGPHPMGGPHSKGVSPTP